MFYLSTLNKLFNISKFELFVLLLLLIIYAFLEIVGIGFLITIVINFLNFESQCIFQNKFINLEFLCESKENDIILIALGFFFFKFCFQGLAYYYRIKILTNGINHYLNNNFIKFIFFKPDMLDDFNFFESNTILIKEIENVFTSFADKILDFISELFVFLTLSFVFILILLKINLTPVILLIIFFIIFIFFLSKKTRNIGKKRTDSLIGLNKDFYEIFKNLDILNVYKKNNQFLNLVRNKIQKYKNSIKYSNLIRQLPKFFFEFFIIFCLLLFVLFSSTNLSSNLTAITAISFIFLRLYPTITRMKVSYDSAMFNKYSATKTIKLLEEISLVKKADNEISLKLNDRIKINNISIKKLNKKIINKANFSIKKKDKVLIKGETGSGKSTLLKFLSGNQSAFFSSNEQTSNFEIFNQRYLRLNKISYVPQNPIMFNISIAKNISMELDESKVDQDLIVRLFDELKLNKFCDILDQNLSLDGSSISGGERQRMSIARGLYNNPDIIIMDEPFSSVDPETRDIILNFLRKSTKEKTLIISSHNYEDKDFYNRIFEVKDGKINEI